MVTRRQFVKRGALFIPMIFAPKLIRAQAFSFLDTAFIGRFGTVAASVKDQWIPDGQGYQFRDQTIRNWGASAWTAGSSYSLSLVDMKMGRFNSSVTGNVRVNIYADDGSDHPTGSPLGSSANVDITTFTTAGYPNGATPAAFTFSTPVSITSGTKYWHGLEYTSFSGVAATARFKDEVGIGTVRCSTDGITWTSYDGYVNTAIYFVNTGT